MIERLIYDETWILDGLMGCFLLNSGFIRPFKLKYIHPWKINMLEPKVVDG